MKKIIVKCLFVTICFSLLTGIADAQKKRTAVKRKTTAKKTQTAAVPKSNVVDTAVVPQVVFSDSLPIPVIKKSLRNDASIELNLIKDRTPLPYENIREDDAVYRQRIWRDIDAREKINLPFRYTANEDNGNQRFISILLKAIQDGPDNGGVTAFNAIDDRFTTPMTKADVAKVISGEPVTVPQYDTLGSVVGYKTTLPEVNLDSFYKFRIKEEVVFDKQTSRLYWRILGIAPLKNVITNEGVNLGETELFWVYYPDMRPILAKYDAYNGHNYGARMSWEELFESRMFHGRIVKSTISNPNDQFIKNMMGFKNSRILQLMESQNLNDKIFDYEQNLWSY